MSTISQLKDIKKNMVLIYNNEPCRVIEAHFLRMQQRKPVMQTKLKSLVNSKVYDYSFKQGERIESADLKRTSAQYLYTQGTNAIFMNNETYDQINIDLNTLGDAQYYLTENCIVDIHYWQENIVNVSIPPKVDLQVTETEPGARGDTAQGSVTKPATLETGLVVNVPIFIKEGDVIRINTETGEYVQRIN